MNLPDQELTKWRKYLNALTNSQYQLETGKEVLVIDPKYFRLTEVDLLVGDPTRAKEKLGWVNKIQLAELI